MVRRLVWTLLFLDFLALNVWVVAAGSWAELVRYFTHLGPFGVLGAVDLSLALTMGIAWMWTDARKKGVSPWPYAVATVATGSLGLLAYLVRHGGEPAVPVTTRGDGTLAVQVSRPLAVPVSRVWAVVADYHHVDRFHPYVHHVDMLGAAGSGVGAERVCHLEGMPDVRERVTEWEEGRGYRIESRSKLDWLGRLGGKLWVEPAGDAASTVRFELTYAPRFGAVGRAFGRAMLGYLAGTMGTRVLAGLEHHLHTGGKLPTRGDTAPLSVQWPRTA